MDIYRIPGDTGRYWRMDKLIEYKTLVDYVDVSTLCEFVKRHKLTKNELILCAWYYSLTYSEVTAFWLLYNLDFDGLTKQKLVEFWKTYKPIMQFSSSRMYCKSMDWFVPLMETFVKKTHKKPYGWFKHVVDKGVTPQEKYNLLFNMLSPWKYMGRFSTELFMLAIEAFGDAGVIEPIKADEPPFSWKNGSNVTSGMLNLVYLDEEANLYDKNKYLSEKSLERLDWGLEKLNKRCEQKGFVQESYTSILPRICSFRNLFKCNRYAGYHHDRQLEQLRAFEDSHTNITPISQIYSIRADIYPAILLGEISGWTGIRPERKKLFIQKGVLGIE